MTSTPIQADNIACSDQSWGVHAPHGVEGLLLLLVKCGLGHGPIRRWIERVMLQRRAERPVDIERYGICFRLHPSDNTVEAKLLFGSRHRDAEELQAIRQAVADGGTFVDIGANMGFFSLMAARSGAARVLAIEPIPQLQARLHFNAKTNGYENIIRIVPTAVGAETGVAMLHLSLGDMGASSMVAESDVPREHALTVPVNTLLQVVNDSSINRVNALKIDVEGMEDQVLIPYFRDAPRSCWPRLIVMEHVWQNRWQDDVLTWMLHNGYREMKQTRSNAILTLKDGSAS